MCPDPQLLSIYLDGELPSPWKEKMESHLAKCLECREKLENFRQLHELFKKDTHIKRTFVEKMRTEDETSEPVFLEPEILEAAKDRVWRGMVCRQRFRQRAALWRRRLSIPLPAAAVAIVLVILAALWLYRGFPGQRNEAGARANFILASEEEMPGIIPAADMNGVLQYLGVDGTGTDIIIMRLPESRNFNRFGEPAIIRAADYSGRRP